MGQIVDEFLERLGRGERPDVEEFAGRYPPLAAVLRGMLPALRAVHESAADRPGPSPPAADAIEPEGPLGDFRLVREVGRGGMGVVYEAVQISLGRRVALKVLPFAAALDPHRLQRFRNEAQAAAHLHHQSIVPVYYVGCERGVHFYAMQFIAGRTLAEVIGALHAGAAGGQCPACPHHPEEGPAADTVPLAGLATERSTRRPEFFRTVARLGVQAADALEHAHQEGIVHRDVKPANLLVDGRGNLWVTDFGLARLRDDAGLTASGDLVGTLRYMSPEQALGHPAAVNPSSDVYALGATLYELLTLCPVFEGPGRQELLQQIAAQEPRAPRRLNPAVPVELETVVLKALEKDIRARYGTAQELADDLRRFLEDKPVRARRPSLLERTRKWARRHRAVVWSAAVALLAALAVLAGSVGWVVRDRAARQARTADLVQAAVSEAQGFRERGKWSQGLAAAERAKALLTQGGSGDRLRQGVLDLQADLKMALRLEDIRVQQSRLREGHFNDQGADQQYAEAFREYGIDVEALQTRVAAEQIAARAIRVELAAALDGWARTRRWYPQPGRKSWQALLQVAHAADRDPDRMAFRQAVLRDDAAALGAQAASSKARRLSPVSLVLLCDHLAGMGRYREAVKLLRQAQERHSGDFWINHQLAHYLIQDRPPRPAEAVRFLTAAVAVRPDCPGAWLNLGNVLAYERRPGEALAAYRRAADLMPGYAEAHCNTGIILWAMGRQDEAVQAYREAIRLKANLAEAHGNLGVALVNQGRYAEAAGCFRQAGQCYHRRGPAWAANAAESYGNLGIALEKQGRHAEAVVVFLKAIQLKPDARTFFCLARSQARRGRHTKAVAAYRRVIKYNPDDAEAHCNLGVSLGRLGRRDEEIAALRQAIALRPGLMIAQFNLGLVLVDVGRLKEAVAALRRVIHLKPEYPMAHYDLGRALSMQGRYVEAAASYRRAIALKPDYAEAHCNLGQCLLRLAEFGPALAALNRGHELGRKRRDWPYPSAQWVRDCQRLVELDGRDQAVLRGAALPTDASQRCELAQLCFYKQLDAAAVRLWAGAFRAEPKLADDLIAAHRYYAACAALRAAGPGARVDRERAHWRKQAIEWLRADLTANARLLKGGKARDRQRVRQRLRQWQWDPDLSGLRGGFLESKWPADEQAMGQRLWADVVALLARAEAAR
jgi:serine/threonine protein kinase/Flp pilus assembly protein TadD